MNQFLPGTRGSTIFVSCLLFPSLLVLYFDDAKKFKVILKAKSAVSRLVRMCLAQPECDSVKNNMLFF